MSESRDAVLDFIIAREGEVEGLQSLTSVIVEQTNNQVRNADEARREVVGALNALEKIASAIDISLLNVNIQETEDLAAALFNVISSIRKTVSREVSASSRSLGELEGKVKNYNETLSILKERTASAESTVRNQKVMLKQLAEGIDPGSRNIGSRPVPLKDSRQFKNLANSAAITVDETAKEGKEGE